jgi:microcompartment protein CcmL/EutN
MADPKYDIYFRGEILPGADAAQVKSAIAQIFKADAAKLATLFSGKVNTIKKSVDKATAAKYQQAFKKAGAKAVITLAKEELSSEIPAAAPVAAQQETAPLSESSPESSSKPDSTADSAPDSTADSAPDSAPDSTPAIKQAIADANWDVLPSGSDLLKPDERRDIPDVDIDTSSIKVVSPFAEIEVDNKPIPPAPDTSHISVAEVGEDMNPNKAPPAADLVLDLSSFSIAEAGAALTDQKEKKAPPAPDTSHIELE